MKNKIYTISLSPSIDYVLGFDELKKGKTNRPAYVDMYPAGKAIHSSMILNNLNIKNEALIFIGGDFKNYFCEGLRYANINYKTFKANNNVRINLKLIDKDQTECSVPSPEVEKDSLNDLKNYLTQAIIPGDVVIIAGSLPINCETSIYGELVKIVNAKGGLSVVDAFGETLLKAINEKPFLIKPNIEELEITTNIEINNEEDLDKAIKVIMDKGAQNILLSNGDKGAILFTYNKKYMGNIPKTPYNLVNAAGAGDSMLAGFVANYLKTNSFSEALKFSLVTGTATAYSNRIADVKMIDNINKYINTIQIIEVAR